MHQIKDNISKQISSQQSLTVQLAHTENAFRDLAPQWQALAVRTQSTVFMTYEWAWAWWKHFGRHKRRSLSVLSIWDDNTLVGLAPFYTGHSSLGNIKIEKRLQLIGSGGHANEQLGYIDDYGISDFLDILVDENYLNEVMDLLSSTIQNNPFQADMISFHQARDDSYIMTHLYPKLQAKGLKLNLRRADTCPYIPLENQDSLKDYIKSLKSANARRRFRQTLRAMEPSGDLILGKEPETHQEVKEATEKLITLHQNRWNRIGFPGVFFDERFTNFFKDIVYSAFDNGWLWLVQMSDNKGVCASRMLLRYNDRYYDYISGFDRDRPSSKYRPGIGLLIEAVRDAINDEDISVELMRGEENYKFDFTSQKIRNWKLVIHTENNRNIWKQALSSLCDIIALCYKHLTCEIRLLKVQYQQQNLFKMIPDYIAFRWESLKHKIN
jgi:CelD/BcsL family acetyltransferase involved in cellulose biosynthesis